MGREEERTRQGRVLRELREAAGLDQKTVAALIGVSRPTITQWEGGKAELRLADIHSYAQVLEIPFGLLLERLGYELGGPISFPDWLAERYARKLRGETTPRIDGTLSSAGVRRPGANRLHSTLRDEAHSRDRQADNRPDDPQAGPLIRSHVA